MNKLIISIIVVIIIGVDIGGYFVLNKAFKGEL
ncbi:MAG: hypothetical protein UU18_C0003G0025 [Parcubacteria group bacterium GW2011_GWB2_40_8]|nr:MAG: hypothetical protein UT71_C0006G0045 [Parcubacteria group bacterium GW2011_GWF2_40_10]KKR47644.1 MAG: hypothetical protein UT83_C0006G0021 [Parcubacteria group bacterium GW2011_GWA2_40_143]KKR60009.1 MAG: hypothetical protein UT97_C0007G0045 [Parcubacteria group bacterium GW2011_GWC2_40_31]KKR75543.1 MAG: hypothetical protein UU18_C0003G0025 [Parcubacteria group bacterium GW2011_GWB2_40_8]KKR77653.1 MAG: hypothetical protein UU20_C0003G0028 [Parcubacteria group bacterium GW2011_GWE2_40_